MSKKILKLSLKIAVSAVFIFWIIFKINWNEVLFYLREISWWQIGFYVIAVITGILISAYKWKLLAEFKSIQHKLGDFFKFYLAGTFINNFMPSFIGGDTFRAYQIGKKDGKYIEAASSVMVDRLTGFFGATILALLFGFLNFSALIHNRAFLTTEIFLILFLFFDIFIAKARQHPFFQKIGKYLPEKIKQLIGELDGYNNNSHILSKTVWYAVLFNLIGVGLANYILFRSLGIQINFLDYLSVIFLISIVSSVPISINNIGVKEWAYITFFGFFGLNSSAVITAAILSRFIQMLISFFALPVYFQAKITGQENVNSADQL